MSRTTALRIRSLAVLALSAASLTACKWEDEYVIAANLRNVLPASVESVTCLAGTEAQRECVVTMQFPFIDESLTKRVTVSGGMFPKHRFKFSHEFLCESGYGRHYRDSVDLDTSLDTKEVYVEDAKKWVSELMHEAVKNMQAQHAAEIAALKRRDDIADGYSRKVRCE